MSDSDKTIDLKTEAERIATELEEVTDRMADMDPSTDVYQSLDERSSRLETYRRGVGWLRGFPEEDYPDTDDPGSDWETEEITLRRLSMGDGLRLDEHTSGETERTLWQIAIGTHDAPYLEHDGEEYPEVPIEDVEETVAVLDEEPPLATGRWLQDRVDEVSTVGNPSGAGSYAHLLTTKRSSEMSPTA
ncbi:hypothetical protein DVK05_09845 [Halorubrum sp. Atlit-8R]|uniref:hypothetical protein n=1 Tax=Halorubrum sp. Atlit-8R TaxID=2282126 RepID=UPI000EF1D447|nr:hypothetical protein [Halorubrum sp. Atlit-8R]RLM81289.1 hypothetical protein DVK05_09845 [Halorubrum sp. Atlit-8R]